MMTRWITPLLAMVLVLAIGASSTDALPLRHPNTGSKATLTMLRGHVSHSDGKAARGAIINISAQKNGKRFHAIRRTGPRGNFFARLLPGQYVVKAHSGKAVGMATLTVTSNSRPTVNITLHKGASHPFQKHSLGTLKPSNLQ